MTMVIELAPIEIIVEDHTTAPVVEVEVAPVLSQINVEVSGVYLPGGGAPGTQTLTHTQSTPAATWTIPNTPGARAIVLGVYDSAGRMGLADVIITETNTVITFSQPRTGSVDYLRG